MSPCPACDSTDGNARWGHEERGIYDGVLYWSCAACGHVWPRDFGSWVGLQRMSDAHVAEVLRLRAKADHPSHRG